MKCPECRNTKFSLTEVTTITNSFLVDTHEEAPLPEFKETYCSKTYSFVCRKCGKVLYFGEQYPVETTGIKSKKGTIFDIDSLIERIIKEE